MTLDTYAIVDDVASFGSVPYPHQRKEFYAAGRFWVFYYRDGQMCLKTSADLGVTWSAETIIRVSTRGYKFAVRYDGTYLHYVYADHAAAGFLKYRMGTPNADGTITWIAVEQTILNEGAGVKYEEPVITTDTGGYPWVGYRRTAAGTTHPWAARSSTKNGTWTTDFVSQLKVDHSIVWHVVLIPLSANKIYAIYYKVHGDTFGKLYDGGWGAEEAVSTRDNCIGSGVAETNDDVHFAYAWDNGLLNEVGVEHRKRDHVTGLWSTVGAIFPTLIDSDGAYMYIGVSLSLDRANSELWCFFTYEKTMKVYCRRFDGAAWGDTHTIFEYQHDPVCYYCTSVYEDLGDYLAFMWAEHELGVGQILYHVMIQTPARHTLTVNVTPGNAEFTVIPELQNPEFTYTDEPAFSEDVNHGNNTVTMSELCYVNEDIVTDVQHGLPIRWQYKGFRALGRRWLFYNNLIGGFYDLYYVTSADEGVTWEAPIQLYADISGGHGETSSLVFDGTYIHASVRDFPGVYYRRGLPAADGTITWDAAWFLAYPKVGNTNNDHVLALDSEGYPYILWCNGANLGAMRCWVTKSSNNNGIWATAGGYPLQLYADQRTNCIIMPLPNQDMLALAHTPGLNTIKARRWNFATLTWGADENCSDFQVYDEYAGRIKSWSWYVTVDDDGDAHLIYLREAAGVYYIRSSKRSYATGIWGAEATIVDDNIDDHCSPVLCLDRSSGNLMLFFVGEGYNQHRIYILPYKDGTWSATPVLLINEVEDELVWQSKIGGAVIGDSGILSVFYERIGDYVVLFYITGKAPAPYQLKSLILDKVRLEHQMFDEMMPGAILRYRFLNWLASGDTNRVKTFNITANTNITAVFQLYPCEGIIGEMEFSNITGLIEEVE